MVSAMTLRWLCLAAGLSCLALLVDSQTTYSVSSFHSQHYGPDGIVMGRSGYQDSTGRSRFTRYHVGKDGKRKLVSDDAEGDIESRSLLPDPTKLALPGVPALPGLAGIPGFEDLSDPEAFFRSLGIPKSALLPPFFPKDLLPHSLLSELGPNGKPSKQKGGYQGGSYQSNGGYHNGPRA